MKKIIYSLVVSFLFINVYAQQRYAYLPEGKTFFQTSYQKLIVKYKNELKAEQLKRFVTDSSLNKVGKLQNWNVFDVRSSYRNKDSLVSVLKILQNDSDILYANPFLIYSDGTLQGLTNQLIVRLKTSTNIDFLSSKFKKLKVIAIDKNKYIDREYILTINTGQQLDALDIADTLFETGLFDYCEPDFVKLGMFKTTDPVYNLQWGVHNTGQYNGTPNADINLVNAWNIATGTGIKVAVLDEGVDLNQPDLQANLLTGYDALSLGSNGGPSGDDAHGTACAGIIAAVANNNIGVTGVAYSSKIVPVRVGSNETISITAAVAGINWAASSTGGNADILSCSWGGGGSSSASLNTAIANAISNGRGGKGCVVLFSSGNNNNSSISYPSNQPNVIAVGGTNPCDQRVVITPTTPPHSRN
ncbi:MAG: S8 family serine peptidase [Bacteroidetes bacterium]|nr:S8 family serine peptidase [Bacteroidota bacterium]